jgi:rRNA maturation endonuclease Nob1
MATVRRCLGCSARYPATEAQCSKCGSYAAEVEQEREPKAEPKAKPTRRRKT